MNANDRSDAQVDRATIDATREEAGEISVGKGGFVREIMANARYDAGTIRRAGEENMAAARGNVVQGRCGNLTT